jgi:hypothetical protein
MSGGIGAPCGLCGVLSSYLVVSQWGQVCRPCLHAKSRAAVRGASVPVQAPVESQGPRQATGGGVAVTVTTLSCSTCQQPLQPVRASGGILVWMHPDPEVRARCAQLAEGEPSARDEALREEGRQQGLQEERAAVQKELEAVARVLSRRDEPGSSIVAALIDWVQSRNEEGG